jgi:hypothetical protein
VGVFAVVRNAFVMSAKQDVDDPLDMTVGDPTAGLFVPRIGLSRWKGLANLGLTITPGQYQVQGVAAGFPSVSMPDTGTVRVKYGNVACTFYGRNAAGDHPDGAFQFDILLTAKPKTNRFTWAVTSDLDWFVQPPLTQADIDGNAILDAQGNPHWYDTNGIEITSTQAAAMMQPDVAIHSVAIYHKTLRDNRVPLGGYNHKTGKVCHLDRPWITDNGGHSTWGDWEYDAVTSTLTLVMPETFWQTAVYPVLIDPTFGYASIGVNNESTANWMCGYRYTGAVGTLTKYTAYLQANRYCTTQTILYNQSNMTLVAGTKASGPQGNTTGWFDSSPAISGTISAIDYVMTLWGDVGRGSDQDLLRYDVDTGHPNYSYRMSRDYQGSNGAWPTTWTGYTTNNHKYSIYGTYSAVASRRRASAAWITG